LLVMMFEPDALSVYIPCANPLILQFLTVAVVYAVAPILTPMLAPVPVIWYPAQSKTVLVPLMVIAMLPQFRMSPVCVVDVETVDPQLAAPAACERASNKAAKSA